jgi:hypothetical protein
MPRIATTNPAIAPEWNRALRYGAVLVIIICTVIALRPLLGGSAVGHARPVAPATTHPRLPATCASSLKGRFVFISEGPSTMNASARCSAQKPVLLSV